LFGNSLAHTECWIGRKARSKEQSYETFNKYKLVTKVNINIGSKNRKPKEKTKVQEAGNSKKSMIVQKIFS
jgi:hypothetical protein